MPAENGISHASTPSIAVALVQMNSGADKERNIAKPGPGSTVPRPLCPAGVCSPRSGPISAPNPAIAMLPSTSGAARRCPGRLVLGSTIFTCTSVAYSSRSAASPGSSIPRWFTTPAVRKLPAIARSTCSMSTSISGTAYRESSTIAPGDEIVTFELDGVTVGLAICYDLRFPELFRILALRGAEAIILPAAFTMTTGKDHWETPLTGPGHREPLYMVAVGQVGQHLPGLWCYGRSMVVDPWGTVIAQASDYPTVITTQIEPDYAHAVRRQVPSLRNRLPDRHEWPDEESRRDVPKAILHLQYRTV